jgi:hypothetical protein
MKKVITTTEVFSLDAEELRKILIEKFGVNAASSIFITSKSGELEPKDVKITLRYNNQLSTEIP